MAKDHADVLEEARKRFDIGSLADQDNREEMAIDLRFRAGDQWPAEFKAARERDRRPCLTINRLGQFVRKITGDIRLNPPGIKVRPVDGGPDTKLAETLTGLIRNIEAQSDAPRVYAQAADAQVSCGLGWMRVATRYCSDTVWEQDIVIELIPNPFAVVDDPAAVSLMREDGGWRFVTDMVPIEDFKAQYPNANLQDWERGSTANWGAWREDERIRVAEYWRKVPVKKRLAMFQSGKTIDLTGMDEGEVANLVMAEGPITRERMADSHRVEMWKMNGVEVLEPVTQWAGKYIPHIPVIGEEVFVGERVVRMGLIRQMRDSQTLYNVGRTALAETVAMAPKAKWLATPKQMAGHEDKWATANTSNMAFLPYNPDPAGGGIPQRIQPEMPSAAHIQDLQVASADMEAISGIYRENMGAETNANSGRAILSRQRAGDVGTFVYSDNLAASVGHVGRICVDLIPKIYDSARQVRILGEDGQEEFVPLNSWVQDPATGQFRKVNDLSVGSFDVVPSTGQSFSTRQEEGREAFVALMGVNPEMANLGMDIFAKMQNFPGADEFARRVHKAAVAKGIAEPAEGEPPPQPPPPDPNAMLAQAEMQKAQAAMINAQGAREQAQYTFRLKMAELQLKGATVQQNGDRLALDTAVAGEEAQRDAAELRHEFAMDARNLQLAGERDMLKGYIDAGKFAREMAQPPAQPEMRYGQP